MTVLLPRAALMSQREPCWSKIAGAYILGSELTVQVAPQVGTESAPAGSMPGTGTADDGDLRHVFGNVRDSPPF
jgi:hypothetical protein